MGANAQTSVPTFTAGDVLTAANMNISARTGVPVFADTTARDAGFGGTGEKTLAEGQLCYVENLTGAAQIQYYDGASWVSLGSGALQYITGNSFSAVASVSLPNSTFTATYANYLIVWDFSASTSAGLTMRMRASGADNSTANYNSNGIWHGNGGSSATFAANGATSFTLSGVPAGVAGRRWTSQMVLFGPQATQFTAFIANGSGGSVTGTEIGGYNIGGDFEATTSFDALSLIPASGNITGTYRVYGYVNS